VKYRSVPPQRLTHCCGRSPNRLDSKKVSGSARRQNPVMKAVPIAFSAKGEVHPRFQRNANSQRCDPGADRAHPDVNQDFPQLGAAASYRSAPPRAAFPDFAEDRKIAARIVLRATRNAVTHVQILKRGAGLTPRYTGGQCGPLEGATAEKAVPFPCAARRSLDLRGRSASGIRCGVAPCC
jgi:hypothetical protein